MKDRMDLHAIAQRLGISEWPNKTGVFCSPLRPDNNESFSIFEKNGELFWRDHATDQSGDSILLIQEVKQCGPKEAILWLQKECGFEETSEPSKKKSKSKGWENRELVCIYDYKTADGAIVHQTLRYRDKETGQKTFLQRRVAQEGEKFGKYEARLDRVRGGWWIWSLSGVEPVLYNLDQITSRPDEEIWLFEGEKDADNARKLGFLSTTSPMGAGKWRNSFSNSLAGRNVTICPDRDEPGKQHAVMVSKALAAAGCQVHVIRWEDLWPDAPGGKLDFTDWGENFLRSKQTIEK